LSLSEWNLRSPSALAARYSLSCSSRTDSRHRLPPGDWRRPFPAPTSAAEAGSLCSGRVVLSCPSTLVRSPDSPTPVPRHFCLRLIGGVTRPEIGPGGAGVSRVTSRNFPCMPPLIRRGAGGRARACFRRTPRGSLRRKKSGSGAPDALPQEGSDVTTLHVGSLPLRPAGLRRLPKSLCRTASRQGIAPPPAPLATGVNRQFPGLDSHQQVTGPPRRTLPHPASRHRSPRVMRNPVPDASDGTVGSGPAWPCGRARAAGLGTSPASRPCWWT